MDDAAARMERRLQLPVLVGALLTIPAIVIEQSDVDGVVRTLGNVLNWVSWSIFFAEVILMLRVVEDRGRWLRDHPLELVIVLLTPPILPAGLEAARFFRLLRVLRLLRLALLARRMLSTEGIRDAAIFAVVTVLGGGAAFSAVERSQDLTTWDGVWWAITTVTTVGYGDIYPETVGDRIIGIVVMSVGIGFVAILTGAVAQRFLAEQRQESAELARVELRLDEVLARLDAMDARATGVEGDG